LYLVPILTDICEYLDLGGVLILVSYFRFIQERLRTPNGREVVFANVDTTDIKVDRSSDAYAQMQTFSGDRQKGHCVFFCNITDASGAILAITPGPNVACPPRGGDGVSMGVHLGVAQEQQRLTGSSPGFSKLLEGSRNIGVCLDFDRGYVYQPRVNTGSHPTLLEYCQQNDILPLYRAQTGEFRFTFNRQTNLLEQVPHNNDETIAANSGRIATYLRAASENTHTFKRGFKLFAHQAHNSRMNAVGHNKISYYNRRYGKNYGVDYEEQPKLQMEYMVMAGRFNEWHAKYSRYGRQILTFLTILIHMTCLSSLFSQ
jgi:hypothetical protein